MSQETVNEGNRPFRQYKYLSLLERDLVESISTQILDDFSKKIHKAKQKVTDILIISFVDKVLKDDSEIRNEIYECFSEYYDNEYLKFRKIDILIEIIKLRCLDHFVVFNNLKSFKDIESRIDSDIMQFNCDEVFTYGKSILDLNEAEYENIKLFVNSRNKDDLIFSISDYTNCIKQDIEWFHELINRLQSIKNDFDNLMSSFNFVKRSFGNLKANVLKMQHNDMTELPVKEFTREKRFAIYDNLVSIIIGLNEIQTNLEYELRLPKEFNGNLLKFNPERDFYKDEQSYEIITNLIRRIEKFNHNLSSHIFSNLNLGKLKDNTPQKSYSSILKSKLLSFKEFPYLSRLKDFEKNGIAELNKIIKMLFIQQFGDVLREKFEEFKKSTKNLNSLTFRNKYKDFIEQLSLQFKNNFENNYPELTELQELLNHFEVEGLYSFVSAYNYELNHSNLLSLIKFEIENKLKRIENETHQEISETIKESIIVTKSQNPNDTSKISDVNNIISVDNEKNNHNSTESNDDEADTIGYDTKEMAEKSMSNDDTKILGTDFQFMTGKESSNDGNASKEENTGVEFSGAVAPIDNSINATTENIAVIEEEYGMNVNNKDIKDNSTEERTENNEISTLLDSDKSKDSKKKI